MSDDLYITLVGSNRKEDNSSSFVNYLAKDVDLYQVNGRQGFWTCALVELIGTFSIDQVPDPQKFRLFEKGSNEKQFILPSGNYRTASSLANSLNSLFQKNRKRREAPNITEGSSKKLPVIIPPGADKTKPQASVLLVIVPPTATKSPDGTMTSDPATKSPDEATTRDSATQNSTSNNPNLPIITPPEDQKTENEATNSSNQTSVPTSTSLPIKVPPTATKSPDGTMTSESATKKPDGTMKSDTATNSPAAKNNSEGAAPVNIPPPIRGPITSSTSRPETSTLVVSPPKSDTITVPKSEYILPQGGIGSGQQDVVMPSMDLFEKAYANYGVGFMYDENKARMRIEVDGSRVERLILPKLLMQMLGFEYSTVKKSQTAKYMLDLNGTLHNLYVYSDVVQPSLLGSTQSDLLRIIPVDFDFQKSFSRVFNPPIYRPVKNGNFNSITIRVTDEFGQPVRFNYGVLIATLHFKRVF